MTIGFMLNRQIQINNYRKHFESSFQWSLRPTKDISFVFHSANIWKVFQKYICDNKITIDLGCGSGTLLYNIQRIAAKYNNCKVFGYDFSEEAISFARKLCPTVEFKTGDVTDTNFKYNTFDIICSTMLIEHVDDEKFLAEISRIIKPKGVLLLTTVMKTVSAWYYLKDERGESVLELSHLREYSSADEIISKLEKHDFNVVFLETPKIRFSILDFLLIRLGRILKKEYFLDLASRDTIVKLRKILKIPLPGYHAIELIALKGNLE